MQWLLLFLYCTLICWGISRINFFKNSGIKIQWWILIFLFKVLIGILYGYLHSLSFNGGDTLHGFKQGVRIYKQLHNHGIEIYTKLVFLPCRYPPYTGIEKWANNSIPYGDESYYFIIRLHAIIALISGKIYNVHVVFFNMLYFSGVALLYSAFKDQLKEKSSLLLAALILIPSVVFWTSGIHKDGLALLGIGLIFYSLKKGIKYSWQHFLTLALGIALLYIIRSYILAILVPFVLTYFFYQKKETHLWRYYLGSVIIFSSLGLLIYSICYTSPFQKIAEKQEAFIKIPDSENTLFLPALEPNSTSFLQIIPYSINHSFIQPLPWKAINFFQFVVGIQDIVLLFLLLYLIVFNLIKRKIFPHLFYLSIGYTLSLYTLLGIIVPNLGALSRYKCTGTFFLALAIISILPIEWFRKYFKY